MSQRFYRRVIQIRAVDSPNVKLGLAQAEAGLPDTGLAADGMPLLPGVLDYAEYLKRRATWDEVRQCVGLDAEFWAGADVLLYPPQWLNLAEEYYRWMQEHKAVRRAMGIGIDPGEGVAESAFYAVDERGVIEGQAWQTPNTNVLPAESIKFMERHRLDDRGSLKEGRVCIDRGGGGLQLADRLRAMGYPVRTVAFGENITPDPRRGRVGLGQRVDEREERYVYRNRRAQMYGRLRELLDPARVALGEGSPFGIPITYRELRRQLAPLPYLLDGEGRMYLPPKSKPTPNYEGLTIEQLVGCSPDQADALVLAVHAMCDRPMRAVGGAG
jgi:hypothetical protein